MGEEGKEQAMDMVDRYVKAVAKALPEEQREDISNELTEDIRSEIEDRERELGRPMTEAEQEGLLKQRGNPLVLAARYRQDHRSVAFGRQIIGPVLYPFYIKVLTFNLGLTFFVITTIFAALAISGQRIGIGDIFSTCLLQLFIQLSVVTLIFSVVEKHLVKHPDRWHLKGMRGGLGLDVEIERDIQKEIISGIGARWKEVSRFESVSIIVASVVALAWLSELQRLPFLVLGPAAAFLKLAPVWQQIFVPIVVLTVAEIVRASINLARPGWVRFRLVARIFLQTGGLAVVYFLIRAGSYVTAADGLANGGNLAHTVEIVNQCVFYSFVGVGIGSAYLLLIRVIQLIRDPRARGGSARVGAAAKEGN